MGKYKITYFKQYEVTADNENAGIGKTDQSFIDDIREVLASNGSGKIHYIFNFNIERIRKKEVLSRNIKKKQ